MKIKFIGSLLVLILGFMLFCPLRAEAWYRHSYVGVSFSTWPRSYYYAYDPYYVEPYYVQPTYVQPTYVVASANTAYQPVIVNGTTYYVNNGVYYLYTQYGYQAVATPIGVAPAVGGDTSLSASMDAVDSLTINVPNDKGGYTPVLLKKSGTGFVGPQGEFYSQCPKVSQLKVMYGK